MGLTRKCIFCDSNNLLTKVPFDGKDFPCRRDVYKDDITLAVLTPEQYSVGHTIVVLRSHKEDIAANICDTQLIEFIKTCHAISKHLKKKLRYNNKKPERIYLSILCDGINHLHAHLIPRYPFNEAERKIYKRLFCVNYGCEKIKNHLEKNHLGGFWYMAYAEINYKESRYWRKTVDEKIKILEKRAEKLRLTSEALKSYLCS